MKRKSSLLFVGLLVVSMLVGCSQTATSTSSPIAPNSVAPSSAAPSSAAQSTPTATESSTAPTPEKPLVLKLSHVFSKKTPMDDSLVAAAANIKKRTNGAIDIQVFSHGTIPYGADGVEQCVRGANFINVYDPSVLADWVPDFMAIGGPFLVKTREEFKQLCESDLVLGLDKEAEAKGIKVLALPFNFGFRQIGSAKVKVDSIDSLKSIKMRIPSSQLWVQTFQALGCNTITTPSSEVYNANFR